MRPKALPGFTLLEVMIAVVLLTGAVAASALVFSRAIFMTADTETLTQASALAQEKLESLRGGSFAAIASEPKAAVPGWSGFSREVEVSQPAGTNSDFKQIGVTVYWDTVDGELSTDLTTYVANVSNN
ncbi:MAG: prepilin-type N-terminal cleavage/methylation domain-containing protein [Candidatus Omnitrophica bacterium]|nr:prepilin-type N-terminal cleavage/methylation domain-containing protein [Candidatus Omnitrophota bacterium]